METIKQFIETYKDFEYTYSEFVNSYKNTRSLHNHTLENLFLYFSLEDHIKKGRVHFYPSMVFINDNRRYKWFINSEEIEEIEELFDFSVFSEPVRKKMSFYSSSEISKTLIKTKFKETSYSLTELFDSKTYEEKYQGKPSPYIKKKIYNKIVYPFKYLSKPELKFTVSDLTVEDLEKINRLHEDWCQFKLNDPKVFKMMFSSNRYYRCIVQSFTSTYLSDSNWYRKGFYLDGELVAVRQCLLKDEVSYDIGFFSRFWEIPSNLVNYINIYCMKELLERGITTHNCGNELDKNLRMFKEHFPSKIKLGYKYNFKN